jgi:flagellar motor protein MotB
MRYIKRFNTFHINENETIDKQSDESKTTETPNQDKPVVNTEQTNQQALKPTGKLTNKEEMELQAELNKWSEQYADKFKFKNAEPRMVTDNVVETIIPENQSVVSAAIDSIIQILSQEKYKGKIDKISVIGHTSSTWGKATPQVAAANNQKLSQVRAMSVIKTIQLKADGLAEFIPLGKGLTELIIKNDAVEGAAQAGEGSKQLTSFPFTNLTDPEQKQAINRRVVISLPKFEPKYAPKEETPASPPPAKITKMPVAPKATSIKFNYDSYIPTSSSYNLLIEYANQIAEWNSQKQEKITDIFICAHSNKAVNNNKSDVERQDKVIFIISLNRALIVKKIMAAKLKDVKFHVIPASYYVTKTDDPENNKKVELVANKVNEQVKLARDAFSKLSKIYKVENVNDEYPSDEILYNKGLREDVLKDIKQYSNANKTKRVVPVEYWYEKYGKYEKGFDRLRDKIIKLAGGTEEDAEEYVYKTLI